MSIVVITIPEPSKIKFINDLINTGLPVSLIILQKRKTPSIKEKILYYFLQPKQFAALIILYLRPDLRQLLASLRSLKTKPTPKLIRHNIPLIEVENINDSSVVSKIKEIDPKVISVWGSGLINNQIISAAPHIVNMHLGIAPEYKGALANQFAIAKTDYKNTGYTIHYINEKVDDGDIIHQQRITIQNDPITTFQTLLLDAHNTYVKVIKKIYSSDRIETISQKKIHTKKVTFLKDWTPYKRLALALFLKKWQKNKVAPHKKTF